MNTLSLKKTEIFTSLGFDGTSKIKAYRITKLEHLTALQNRLLENPPSQGKKIPLALHLEDNNLNNSFFLLTEFIKLCTSPNNNFQVLSINAENQKLNVLENQNNLSKFEETFLLFIINNCHEIQHLKLPPICPHFGIPLPKTISALSIHPISDQNWKLPQNLQFLNIQSLPKNSLLDLSQSKSLKHVFISQMHGKIEGKIKLPIWCSNRTWLAYLEIITKTNILSKSKLLSDFTRSLIVSLILTLIHRSISYFLLVALLIPYLLFLSRHF